jgi:membrane protein DedA with SNARE-associated domain
MNKETHMLPVWFFIGILLTIYGIIILGTALIEFSHPPAVVQSRYHPGIFLGILLLLIGFFYTLWFWPRRGKKGRN